MLRFILAILLSAQANMSHAETAEICSDCATETKAQQFATSMANPLQCSPVLGEDVSCSSQPKTVLFVDKTSGQAFKYQVSHQATPPWNVQAQRLSMPPDQEESFRILTRFYRDMNEAISDASMNVEQLLSGNRKAAVVSAASSKHNGVVSLQTSSTCPSDTALAALLDPNKLRDIQTQATIQIGTNLLSQNNEINLNPRKINNTYSLTFKGFSSSLSATGTNRSPPFAATFSNSERITSLSDYLVWDVSIVGYDFQNMPIVNYTLNDASRVAGYSLGALKGQSGPLLIDNACIEERLDQAVAQGVVTSSSTPVGGSGGGSGAPKVTGNDSSTGGIPTGGGGGGCQIVDFFQGGQRLYTFRICN